MKKILLLLAIMAITSVSAMADFYIEYSSFNSKAEASKALSEMTIPENLHAYVFTSTYDGVIHTFVRIDSFKTRGEAEDLISKNGWIGFAYAQED